MEEHKNIKRHFKLKDIEKRNIHTVPEGYFQQLSQNIQAEALKSGKTSKRYSPGFAVALRCALPVVFLIAIILYFEHSNNTSENILPEALLAQVSSEEIINYLADSEMSTDDILNNINLTEAEFYLNQKETNLLNETQFSPGELESLIDEYSNFATGDTL